MAASANPTGEQPKFFDQSEIERRREERLEEAKALSKAGGELVGATVTAVLEVTDSPELRACAPVIGKAAGEVAESASKVGSTVATHGLAKSEIASGKLLNTDKLC